MRKWGKIVCMVWVFVLLFSGCQSGERAEATYLDILENGLGLSEDAVESRYQFDEDTMEVDDSNSTYTVWYPSETVSIVGYDSELRLDFEKEADELIQATYTIYTTGSGEELAEGCYDAMLGVFNDLLENLGETGNPDPNTSDSFPETLDQYGSFENFYAECVEGQEDFFINIYWYLDDEYQEGYHAEMQVQADWDDFYLIRLRFVSKWA